MSIVRKIEIDGQDVLFKASAAIPRIYRLKFQRDIYKDLRILEKSIGEGNEENSNLDLFSLEMFENIAYTMAKHADPKIPNEVDEWLDGFNTFSIYQVLPQLIELWGLNVQTETLTIKVRPLASGYVKAKTGNKTSAETYANWYKSVYMPEPKAVEADSEGQG